MRGLSILLCVPWLLLFMLIPMLKYFTNGTSLYRYQIPVDWPYQETRKLFKEPLVLTDGDQLELKWTDPDEEVIDFNKIFRLFGCFPVCKI